MDEYYSKLDLFRFTKNQGKHLLINIPYFFHTLYIHTHIIYINRNNEKIKSVNDNYQILNLIDKI